MKRPSVQLVFEEKKVLSDAGAMRMFSQYAKWHNWAWWGCVDSSRSFHRSTLPPPLARFTAPLFSITFARAPYERVGPKGRHSASALYIYLLFLYTYNDINVVQCLPLRYLLTSFLPSTTMERSWKCFSIMAIQRLIAGHSHHHASCMVLVTKKANAIGVLLCMKLLASLTMASRPTCSLLEFDNGRI